jgi:hypothetical protein
MNNGRIRARYCFGKTPLETFRSAKPLADEKQLDRLMPTHSLEGVLQRIETDVRV